MDNILYTLGDGRILDSLPKVDTFLGLLDVRTGSFIISAVCLLHPMVYGCTFCMPMSYLLLTIWLLLVMFFAASVVLFVGLIMNKTLLIDLWIWFTLVFIVIMLMLLSLLALYFIISNQKAKVLAVILGILWYILTVYFILVVNSHRNMPPESTDSLEDTEGAGKDGNKPGDDSDKQAGGDKPADDDKPSGNDKPAGNDKPGDDNRPADNDKPGADDTQNSDEKGGGNLRASPRGSAKGRLKTLRKASAKSYSKQ